MDMDGTSRFACVLTDVASVFGCSTDLMSGG